MVVRKGADKVVICIYENEQIKQITECKTINFLPDRMVVMGDNMFLELDYGVHQVYLPEFDMEVDPEFIEEEDF